MKGLNERVVSEIKGLERTGKHGRAMKNSLRVAFENTSFQFLSRMNYGLKSSCCV